jgi:hypothetical protein
MDLLSRPENGCFRDSVYSSRLLSHLQTRASRWLSLARVGKFVACLQGGAIVLGTVHAALAPEEAHGRLLLSGDFSYNIPREHYVLVK